MDKICSNIVKMGLLVLLVMMYVSVSVYGAKKSDCRIGKACCDCPDGQYRMVTLSSGEKKACCPTTCSEHTLAGNIAGGKAFCSCDYPPDGKGWEMAKQHLIEE